ncbi:hypothetical protein [Streptomyces sp. NRRL S-340]|nr:hypothetical protein [Streptomyces sp. NRRL S-340]
MSTTAQPDSRKRVGTITEHAAAEGQSRTEVEAGVKKAAWHPVPDGC